MPKRLTGRSRLPAALQSPQQEGAVRIALLSSGAIAMQVTLHEAMREFLARGRGYRARVLVAGTLRES
jgi:hypothetical protein